VLLSPKKNKQHRVGAVEDPLHLAKTEPYRYLTDATLVSGTLPFRASANVARSFVLVVEERTKAKLHKACEPLVLGC